MIKSFSKLKKQNKEEFRIPKTTQDTIPVDTVYKDGIFKIGNRYTKSYRFLECAGHGISSVGDKPTMGSYRQV